MGELLGFRICQLCPAESRFTLLSRTRKQDHDHLRLPETTVVPPCSLARVQKLGPDSQLESFLTRSYPCPPRLLRRCHPPACDSRNDSLFATRCRSKFGPLHVDSPKSSQGSCYAVQFILKSLAFPLELANYSLDKCFGHEWILTLVGIT